MKQRTIFLIVSAFGLLLSAGMPGLKPSRSISISVPEPSDICLNHQGNGYFVVSDDGFLFETDTLGQVLRKSTFRGFDFESVYMDSNGLFVLDERTRYLYQIDPKTLLPIRTRELTYSGGRNKGFEALCRNPKNGRLIAITEKDPSWIFELNSELEVVNRIRFSGLSDVSAATVWKGQLLFLSDVDHCIARISAQDYGIEKRMTIPVINPEGLAPTPSGQLVVSSDDRNRLYFFSDLSLLLP
jgi:uncharacterized protein YjiK